MPFVCLYTFYVCLLWYGHLLSSKMMKMGFIDAFEAVAGAVCFLHGWFPC